MEQTRLMSDYRVVLDILEDSRVDLSRVLIMKQLTNDPLILSTMRGYVGEIETIDNLIQKLQSDLILAYIRDALLVINKKLKEEYPLLQGKLFQLIEEKGKLPYIRMCFKQIMNFNKVNRDEFEVFLEHIHDFMNRGKIIAHQITTNRSIFRKLCEEAVKEASTNGSLDTGKKLTCSYALKDSYVEGTDVLTIKNGNLSATHSIDLTREIDWSIEKDKLRNDIIKQIKLKIEQNRKVVITEFVDKLCTELKIRRAEFSIVEKIDKIGQYYDFSKGIIHKYINLDNSKICQDFKKDFTSAIHTINYLTICPNAPGKIHINLGICNFFRFIKEETINNIQYMVYESRVEKGKILLHVFADGIRLEGNKRTKALQKLGYVRENFKDKV
jgi:hypothetical protein